MLPDPLAWPLNFTISSLVLLSWSASQLAWSLNWLPPNLRCSSLLRLDTHSGPLAVSVSSVKEVCDCRVAESEGMCPPDTTDETQPLTRGQSEVKIQPS